VVTTVVAAVLGGIIGGTVVAGSVHGADGVTEITQIDSGPALVDGTTDVQTVIARVLPAVVSIDATVPVPSRPSPFGGTTGGGSQLQQGTGIVVTSGGEVVTNDHVVAGATSVTVTLYGSTRALRAEVVATDPADDVALLRVAGVAGLPTVAFGDSDHVQVGDGVVAIGNALGLSAGTPTVTTGIISAEGRTVEASEPGNGAEETLTDVFQTDAAINPGNSGGPLVDSSGKVIAMNTAVASADDGTGQAQDIGFAIPSDRIGQLLPLLRRRAVPDGTAYLGVDVGTVTPVLRATDGLPARDGAVVLTVAPGSPAEAAGIQQGDVIVAFDGTPVPDAGRFSSVVTRRAPGSRATVTVQRDGRRLTLPAVLGSSLDAPAAGA
jgi:putative serine protease PepD